MPIRPRREDGPLPGRSYSVGAWLASELPAGPDVLERTEPMAVPRDGEHCRGGRVVPGGQQQRSGADLRDVLDRVVLAERLPGVVVNEAHAPYCPSSEDSAVRSACSGSAGRVAGRQP